MTCPVSGCFQKCVPSSSKTKYRSHRWPRGQGHGNVLPFRSFIVMCDIARDGPCTHAMEEAQYNAPLAQSDKVAGCMFLSQETHNQKSPGSQTHARLPTQTHHMSRSGQQREIPVRRAEFRGVHDVQVCLTGMAWNPSVGSGTRQHDNCQRDSIGNGQNYNCIPCCS